MSESSLGATAVVLTQAASAQGLAAACALSKVAIDAIPTGIGAVAVCRTTSPGEPERAAKLISQVLRNTPVVLVVQRDGQMSASRWAAGERGEDLPPVLVLDGAPHEVEEVLLGQLDVSAVASVVTSVGMSRLRAARVLAATARGARRS